MLNSLGWHFIAVPAHERILATLDAERAARHAANDNVKRRRPKSAGLEGYRIRLFTIQKVR